jgi:four helix bundle protein
MLQVAGFQVSGLGLREPVKYGKVPVSVTAATGSMATAKQFEDLGVWQDARQLAKDIYAASKRRAFYRDRGLREQVRRAATSTMSNIAEGFERGARREFIQFLNISKGSNGEVRSQLYVALDQEYLSTKAFETLRSDTLKRSRRLSRFINYLERYPNKTRVRKPQRT